MRWYAKGLGRRFSGHRAFDVRRPSSVVDDDMIGEAGSEIKVVGLV